MPLAMTARAPSSPGSVEPPAKSGSRLRRILATVVIAYLTFPVFVMLLTAANPGAANRGVNEAAAWVLLAGAAWFVLRLLLFWWNVLRVVRAGADDTRLSKVEKAERYLAIVSAMVGGAVCVALVVALWPWSLGFFFAAVVAYFLGIVAVLMAELVCLDQRKWRMAAWLLASSLPRLREQLRSPDPTERATAARVIFRMKKHGAPAMPDLIEALRDKSAEVRAQAGLAVYSLAYGPNLPAHLPGALRPLLRDPDARVRTVAAGSLICLGVASAPEVIPALTDGLTHPDGQFAEAIAAGELAHFGTDAAPAIPALRAALFDRHPPNIGALHVLESIGEPAVPVLVDALTHPDCSVRKWTAYYLGYMGKVATAAVEPLQAAMDDQDEKVRRAAQKALKQIRSEQ